MAERHVLGISGGKDSAALAVYMRDRHPELDIDYFFTDTGEELPEVEEFLGKLEGFLGKPITRLNPQRNFTFWLRQYEHFLDVDDIHTEKLLEVPEPKSSTVPSEWLRLFMHGISKNGTLVVWSKLDRISWKQSTTLLRHIEFVCGRIYRKFIDRKRVQIRLAAYDLSRNEPTSRWQSFVRPNDPMYLMTGTSAPSPFDQTPAFTQFESPVRLSIGLRNENHEIVIRASICKPEVRASGGSSPIGRHAKRNQGVSVLRAERELELSKSFENIDPRERWWGIEVEFPPALDDVFGVTNNKQAATGFQRMSLAEDDAGCQTDHQDIHGRIHQQGCEARHRNQSDMEILVYCVHGRFPFNKKFCWMVIGDMKEPCHDGSSCGMSEARRWISIRFILNRKTLEFDRAIALLPRFSSARVDLRPYRRNASRRCR
jgi:hypothetical protein